MTGRLTTAGALAVVVAVIAAAGCRRRAAAPPEAPESGIAATLRDIGRSPAALAVSEPMRPFFAAGLGFIVLGGLTFCFGGRGTGLALTGLGVATTATGVLFVQYPWATLILALAAGALTAAAAWDRLRARRDLALSREALEAAAAVIQNRPEGKAIKEGLAALGEEAAGRIRSVIDPIKAKLRREGKID